jgi:hypothetical protein
MILLAMLGVAYTAGHTVIAAKAQKRRRGMQARKGFGYGSVRTHRR